MNSVVRQKRRMGFGAVIFIILIVAAVAVGICAAIVLSTGLKYIKAQNGTKYFGTADRNNHFNTGRLWSSDAVASIAPQNAYIIESSGGDLSPEALQIPPSESIVFAPPDAPERLRSDTLAQILTSYEAKDKNNAVIVASGTIIAEGIQWTLTAPATDALSYKDFDITGAGAGIFEGDLIKFFDEKRIESGEITLSNGNVLTFLGCPGVYRLVYEQGVNTGDIYIGAVNDNLEKDGEGIYYYSLTGDIYYGDFLQGKKEGMCKFSFAEGDLYTGSIKDGKKDGAGTFKWADGTSYTGSFSDNMKNGQGETVFADGSVYSGIYVNDVKEGYGKYTWASGDMYEGNFSADLYSGDGKYTWASGEYYEGNFMHNTMHGWGTYHWLTGRTYTGWYVLGKMSLIKPDDV